MSAAAPLQRLAARPGSHTNSGHAGLLLQRKCGCGAPTTSLTGKCADCKSKKRLQARLAIGASHDPLEREADRVADEVMAGATHGAPSHAFPRIQRLSGQAHSGLVSAPSSVDGVLAGSGRPLEAGLLHDMAQRFGHDFSGVRVHSDAAAERSASDIHAQAYTVGRDIVFGAGLYEPGTRAGRRLLAHELTHVVQQSASAGPLLWRAPAPALEEDETGAGTTEETAETEDDSRAEDPADGYEAGADNQMAPDDDSMPADAMDPDLASNAVDETKDGAPDPLPLQSAGKKPTTGKWILVKLPGTLIRFDGTQRIDSWGISGGRSGHATPTGKFSIFKRDENHRSSSYGKCSGKPIGPNGQNKCNKQGGTYVGADMHYFQEFASQVGFHRGDPAVPSHGCIHVNAGNAQTLWNWSAIGTPVIVCSGSGSGSGCDTYLGSSSSSKGKSKDTSKPKMLQRRMAASIAHDPLEREADQAADRVLAMRPDSGLGAAPLQLQRVSGLEATGRVAAPASVDGVLAQSGRPLDTAVRQDMAQRFGHDFSRVRVHTGPAAAQSAQDVSADAYTVGQQIVFAAGWYAPHCLAGRHLLAHELAHTLQQSGSSAPGQAQQGLRLPSRRSQLAMRLQRRETGSGLEDPLYAANRAGSSGQGRDDRMTGRRLQNWAIARGSFVIRSDASLMRMQEKDGVESEIIDEIELLLIDLLRGHDARDPAAPEHALTGPGRNVRPEFERTRLDKFEGSDNAREMAVLELLDFWGPIASYFAHALMLRYRDSYLDAAGRTPQDMRIEADTREIRRLRTNQLYRHEHAINQGMAGQVVFRAGQRYGRLHIADLYKTLGSRSTGPGTVWAYLDGQPLWYYSGSVDILDRNAVIGEVARGAAEAARFAAQLLPLLIKAGAFALSFSPAPLLVIASVVLDELGEEGLRDLSGEGRSFKGIAGSAAKEILLNLVLNKLMGGGEGKAASEAAGALEKVAEEAAIKMRASVEKEIVRTEEASVVKAVEAGEMRSVSDTSLVQEGFTQEVAITHEGGSHVYRRKADGEWCRWSEHRLCDLGLDHADESVQEAIVREREAMVAPGQRVSHDTGMKEVAGITGPAPVESGVSGTLGEAGHAAEVTGGRLPKKLKSISSPEDILKERDALLRGDISLREVVEKYPPEGAAQVFFPTAQGGGRFIDHVYLEESTMFVVFRESKNYRRFNLGPKELRQLQKDLAFLSHPRFKGLRIEWRISGMVNQDTLAILDQVRNDSKGLFSYVLNPGVP